MLATPYIYTNMESDLKQHFLSHHKSPLLSLRWTLLPLLWCRLGMAKYPILVIVAIFRV